MLTLIACGGGGGSTDIEGTITFADRTDVEVARFINAAGGTEMFSAESAVDQFGDTFSADPNCPTIAIDGDTATVTGGCTTTGGVAIAGTASVTNPFFWDQIEYNFNSDTHYDMVGLSITQSGFTMTYDGFIDRTGMGATYDADVTVNQMGAALRSDLYYHCSNPSHPSCNVGNSGLELVGVGGATVSGGLSANSDGTNSTADYTLKGTDTLTVHVDAQHCIAWSISGTARGMTCP